MQAELCGNEVMLATRYPKPLTSAYQTKFINSYFGEDTLLKAVPIEYKIHNSSKSRYCFLSKKPVH